MVTTDDFTNADIIYQEALPQIKATFMARKDLREVPIVTGGLRCACVCVCVCVCMFVCALYVCVSLQAPCVQVIAFPLF